MWSLLWIVAGLVIGSFVEWIAHRYVLHNFSLKELSRSHLACTTGTAERTAA